MTRKHKPQTTHKKRPSAPPAKSAKSAATHKAVAAVTHLRDKERAHAAALVARKGAAPGRAPAVHGKVNDSPRPADTKHPPGKTPGEDL